MTATSASCRIVTTLTCVNSSNHFIICDFRMFVSDVICNNSAVSKLTKGKKPALIYRNI